jgi:hypothetical protein
LDTNYREGLKIPCLQRTNLLGIVKRERRNWRERVVKNDSRNDNQVLRTRKFLIEGKQSLTRNGAMPGS